MKKNITTIASLLLTIFFICIMLFVMLVMLDVPKHFNGARAMIFSTIDFIILFVVVGAGKPIAKAVKIGMYAPICLATILYTILAIGITLLTYIALGAALFTFIKLALLFAYFCVIIPLAVVGMNSDRETEGKKEIQKHNL